jgi:hypothetical protein
MNWDETLEHAVTAFGETPRDHLADQVAAHHAQHPETVNRLIDEIAAMRDAGTCHSPWGMLKSRLGNLATSQPKATKATSQAKALERASQWMHAAGIHYDRWPEVHDELFGDRGTLKDHPALEQQLHDLWQELRPIGEQLEQELEERSAKYRADLTEQRAKPNVENADKPPTCSGCGQTEGHSDTCPKLNRMRQLQTDQAQAA